MCKQASPSLKPLEGFGNLEKVCERLKSLTDRLPGFSSSFILRSRMLLLKWPSITVVVKISILPSLFPVSQLLVGRVEVHRLQCKNCQYRFLGQYPSKMYDFFFLSSIYQTGWLPAPTRTIQLVQNPFNWSKWFLPLNRCGSTIAP